MNGRDLKSRTLSVVMAAREGFLNYLKENSMPEIGKMPKGDIITHAPAQADEAGVPHRAPESAPAPRGEQHQKEAHKTVGRNTGRVR